MSQKPTLVFVPGAWHRPSTWNKVTTILESKNYKCICVTLPSVSTNINTTLLDDITAVRNAILPETTQGHDVVLVVHSYGSIPGASAIKGLAAPAPKPDAPSSTEDSKEGHIIGLAAIATGFITTKTSFLAASGGSPPPSWTADYTTGFAHPSLDPGPRELFYHDLPKEEGEYWVSQLGPQVLKPFEDAEHTYAGWMDVPVWYLSTTLDRALPVEVQGFLVGMARDAGGSVVRREVGSGHSPMLSRPGEVVGFLEEAVGAFLG